MHLLRRLTLALWLAIALVASQQVALWHDVGHLDPSAPSSIDCDKHSLCSQVGGGPIATAPLLALEAGADVVQSFLHQRDASIPPRLAYRAHAPPAPSA
jgi:hypothetical protein